MKKLILALILLFAVPAFAQNYDYGEKFGAFGVGFNKDIPSNVLGWAAIGIKVGKIVSFTSYDVAGLSEEPRTGTIALGDVQLQYTIRTSAAVRIFEPTKWLRVYALGGVGIATNGENVGGSYAAGGFVDVSFTKHHGAIFVLEADKNTLRGTEFNPRVGYRIKF